MKKWHVVGPFAPYSVLDEDGDLVASLVYDKGNAFLIAQLPELKEIKHEWASIINRLARLALDGAESEGWDYAQDMIDMVRPYLGGAFCEFEEEGV